jgi:hypothetical protein
MRKPLYFVLAARYGILCKGGALPPGSIRVWGGVKYRKFGPGDWRPLVERKGKSLASLKDHIHTIFNGTDAAKEKLQRSFFHVADTPEFLKNTGLTGDYFSVRYGVITRHMGKDEDHDLSEKNWLELCEEIRRPFAIAKHGEGYRLFTNIQVNGKFTVVGVDVKNIGKGLEVNAVSTAFGYNKAEHSKENFIYISKKITPAQVALLEGLNSLQYPPGGATFSVSFKSGEKSSGKRNRK